MRLIGASDLVVVAGLLRGTPRSPWMVGRAALNLVIAAYLKAAAPESRSPELLRGGARVMLGLTAVDGATALGCVAPSRADGPTEVTAPLHGVAVPV